MDKEGKRKKKEKSRVIIPERVPIYPYIGRYLQDTFLSQIHF